MKKSVKKPSKPYKDFPLFPHASGQWAKKIRGRLHYFGVWRDPDAARKKYLDERDYLQAGEAPPVDPNGTTLATLCNHFLTAKNARVESRELTQATWADYHKTCELLINNFSKGRDANTISPKDFSKLRGVITSRYGPVRSSREITQVRMVFRWGHEQELIGSPRFGAEFKKPKKEALRRHRQEQPPKMFESAEIRSMLGIASRHIRAWILLGINGAFIQKDLSDLTIQSVDLNVGVINLPRMKTTIERRTLLWPETVEALQGSFQHRPDPINSADAEQFFITRQGNRLVRTHESGWRSDAVRDAMKRIQKRLGIKQLRRSFGALRHTFRTIADETLDFPAILRIMGHSDNTISDHYRERIDDDRLIAVVNHVRDWLFEAESNT